MIIELLFIYLYGCRQFTHFVIDVNLSLSLSLLVKAYNHINSM